MISPSKNATRIAASLCFAATTLVPMAGGATPPDLVYIHCNNGGGDYRISELNHTVSRFSVRLQQYRSICPTCEVIEWGDRITMKDGARTYVQIDRLTGDMVIQRAGGSVIPGGAYTGNCQRGAPITPRTTRAF